MPCNGPALTGFEHAPLPGFGALILGQDPQNLDLVPERMNRLGKLA
jgi:hypothetical protein